MLMLERYAHNPIVSPIPTNSLLSKKVYNSTALKHDDVYYLFFRGVGDDWISRIFLATSKDGLNFDIIKEPVISPDSDWDAKGCEDPRITHVGNKFWISYTAYDGTTARSAVASSDNLYDWTKHGFIFPEMSHPQREDLPNEWHKSAAMFPEKFNDKYLLLYGDNHIWSAGSTNLINWSPNHQPIISAREGFFDAAYVEMGPAPIKTNKGWLVIYHGIDKFDSNRSYRLGAALLDLNNPLAVIWRCKTAILEPTEIYERIGLIDLVPGGYSSLKHMTNFDIKQLADENRLPTAVFCCGAIKEGNLIRLYYGAGDTRICTASVDLDTIIAS